MEQEGSISERGGNKQSSGAGAPGTVRGAVPEGMASSQWLGTQEHWDAIICERELQTLQEYGDTGLISFVEAGIARLR